MKYCLNCGRAFADSYIYCDNCRTFLATNEQFYYIQQYNQQMQASQQYMQQYIQQYLPYNSNRNIQQNNTMHANKSIPNTGLSQNEQKKNPNWLRILCFIAFAWVGFVLVLAVLETAGSTSNVGEENVNTNLPAEQQTETQTQTTTQTETQPTALPEAEVERRIYEILDSTNVVESFAPTIGQMVVTVFSNFEITYELQADTTDTYRVSISGDYYPNPEIPYLIMSGTMVYRINIESGTCVLVSDPNNIEATFAAYIFDSF